MPPPSRDRFTQDDAHHDAHEEIARRGLPPDMPYVAWHYQAHCFNRAGALTDALYVYFGGDRSVVATKLATVPDRFVVSGGHSDADAFRLQRRLNLGAADVANPAVDAKLVERLTKRMRYRGDGRPILPEALTEDTLA